MKGHFLIILFFFNSLATYSQPQGINYQGVARDSIGHPVLNQNISLKLSILDGSETGVVVYSEIHSVLTSTSGLFNISIGMGNTVSGLFANVSWGKGNKWLKIEMDAIGGSNYQLIGNMQFMSVPYAIQSQNTTNIFANVSSFGDTLFIGNTSIKIPGISNYNRGACSPGESTATDIDGNIYDVISIGSQCWLKQNLKVTHFNNNVAITNIIFQSYLTLRNFQQSLYKRLA